MRQASFSEISTPIMSTVRILDKEFIESIPAHEIHTRIQALGSEITRAYAGQVPLVLSVLNGAFIFTADLMRQLCFDAEVQFVRVSSYHGGLNSSGSVKQIMGVSDEQVRGRPVLITEDIVDTGHTIEWLRKDLRERGATDVKVACMLFKHEAFGYPDPPEFVGFSIPNEFVVGYGLDYGEHGRFLPSIYKLKP
jgi:hypoxanthine phosphoribosyltransferase